MGLPLSTTPSTSPGVRRSRLDISVLIPKPTNSSNCTKLKYFVVSYTSVLSTVRSNPWKSLGLVIGVVGLTGAFSVCVDCFDLVQTGRSLSKDHIILSTRLHNHRMRFHAWGSACGLDSSSGYDHRLEDPGIREDIIATMQCIVLLFIDGNKLTERYKRSPKPPVQQAGADADQKVAVSSGGADADVFRESRRGFLARVSRGNAFSAVRWALGDKKDFKELLDNLNDLIGALERATAPFPAVAERQRQHIEWEIETINDVETLEAIAEAQTGDGDIVSSIARSRLEFLHDGSSRTSRGTVASSASTQETYHTAPTHQGPELMQQAIPEETSDQNPAEEDNTNPKDHGLASLPQNTRVMRALPSPAASPDNLDQDLTIDAQAAADYEQGVALAPLRDAIQRRLEEPLPDAPPSTTTSVHDPGYLRRAMKYLVGHVTNLVAIPLDNLCSQILIFFQGPLSTPYAGGIFVVQVTPAVDDYNDPPNLRVLTKTYHPNIDPGGNICIDAYQKGEYNPVKRHPHYIGLSVASVLGDPGLDDPLVPEIARSCLENRSLYNENARKYTEMYATLEAAMARIPPLMEQGPGK